MSVAHSPRRLLAIPEPATAFHRRLHVSITCCANGRPERLQRPTLRHRPPLREPQRLGNALLVVPPPEPLDRSFQRDPVSEEELTLEEGSLLEEYELKESLTGDSISASESIPELNRPVKKTRNDEADSSVGSWLEPPPSIEVKNGTFELQRPPVRPISPPPSIQDSDPVPVTPLKQFVQSTEGHSIVESDFDEDVKNLGPLLEPLPKMEDLLVKPKLQPKTDELPISVDSDLLRDARRPSLKGEEPIIIEESNEDLEMDDVEQELRELKKPEKPMLKNPMNASSKPQLSQPQPPKRPVMKATTPPRVTKDQEEGRFLVVDPTIKDPVPPKPPMELQKPLAPRKPAISSIQTNLEERRNKEKEIIDAHNSLIQKNANFTDLINEVSRAFETDDSVLEVIQPKDKSPFEDQPVLETVSKRMKPDFPDNPTTPSSIEANQDLLEDNQDLLEDNQDLLASLERLVETPVNDLIIELDSDQSPVFDFSDSQVIFDPFINEEIEGEEWKPNQVEPLQEIPRIQRPIFNQPSKTSIDQLSHREELDQSRSAMREIKLENQKPIELPRKPSKPITFSDAVAPQRPTKQQEMTEPDAIKNEFRIALQRSRSQRLGASPPIKASSFDQLEQEMDLESPVEALDEVLEGIESPVIEDRATPELLERPIKQSKSLKDNEIARQFLREKYKDHLKQIEQDRIQEREDRRSKAKDNKQRKLERRGKRTSDPDLIDMRRKARHDRQERRQSQRSPSEKELIIEVGAEGMSVSDLAQVLAVDPTEVMKTLFIKGVMVTVNQTLDMESVKVVANEMDVVVAEKVKEDVTDHAKKVDDFLMNDEDCILRPPVVTVMGHVDHGKTSLLDYIRQTSVASREAGGITQAIGAYTCSVQTDNEEKLVCFLDTPGHEAFSEMRARGAKLTDIAIIIIAADDGIQPQTREAISHAQAANVPLIIAINKIDAPGADPDRIKRQLSEIELLPEEWGGETPVISISAKTGEGVQDLLELITLVSEIQLDLKANPNILAKGTVVEAYLDKRAGVVSTLLVQNGTLRIGDAIVSGASHGKVKSLSNEIGGHISEAGPSCAIQMLGFDILPSAGEIFEVCDSESSARSQAQEMAEVLRQKHLIEAFGGGSMVTLSSLASIDEEEDSNQGLQRINLVLKADTSGSLEAIRGALNKLPQDSIALRYLHSAAGEVTESDVLLAAAAEGLVFAFKVSISEQVSALAKQKGVEVNGYSVIYHLLDDVRGAMEGKLSPTEDRVLIGAAEVKAVFEAGSRKVAGCKVLDGRLESQAFLQVTRKNKVIFEGFLSSLKRAKESVNEVVAGLECGVGCDEFFDWQEEDRIEAYLLTEKRATLEESHATRVIDEDELQELIGIKNV